MQHTRSGSKFVLLIAAASLVAGAAITSLAVPAVASRITKTPMIATVSLEDVFNSLNERADAVASLQAFQKGFQDELNKLTNDIKDQESKLQYAEGQGKKDTAVTLIQTRAGAKVRAEVCQALIDQRQGEVFAALYRKIEAASKQLATQNGYTLVVVTDESVKVPDGPSADTQRTIALKRFLYVDKSAHDITTDLVTLMNNEYKAGVNAAPAAAGAPAPAPGAAPR